MDGIYLDGGEITLRHDLEVAAPAPGEVLLQIRLAGICGTDLALMQGYAGFSGVLGHEFVADVVALGSGVDAEWLGQRVAVEINQGCGECGFCCRQQPNHCAARRVIGIRNHQGAFAQQLVVQASTLHALPPSVSDEQAVFIEPLAAALRIVEQLESREYEDVVLIGAGRLGQLIARVMVLQGKRLRVVVRHARQRTLLAGLALSCITEKALKTDSADVVIEASGHPSGLALALQAVRPMGCCLLKSSYCEAQRLDLSTLVINEIELLGSRCGPFHLAIEVLATGRVDIAPLIEARYPLVAAEQAFVRAQQRGSMKLFLTF